MMIHDDDGGDDDGGDDDGDDGDDGDDDDDGDDGDGDDGDDGDDDDGDDVDDDYYYDFDGDDPSNNIQHSRTSPNQPPRLLASQASAPELAAAKHSSPMESAPCPARATN